MLRVIPSFLPSFVIVTALAGLAATSAGCSSDSGGSGDNEGTGTATQATTCEKDTRKDVYIAGLEKRNATLVVKVVDATPAPPQKLMNAMTFEVLDAGGQPVDGATVIVTPFMPDHGHGSAVVPVVEPLGAGKYAVSKLYYAMPGLWRLTVSVQLPGATSQDVAFQFCIEG